MKNDCFICGSPGNIIVGEPKNKNCYYNCKKCGFVYLTDEAVGLLRSDEFSDKNNKIISIVLRNQWEEQKETNKFIEKLLTCKELNQIVENYTCKKNIDNSLLNINKTSKYIGGSVTIEIKNDYPYYHCFSEEELLDLLNLLYRDEYIFIDEPETTTFKNISIRTKGYERLRELNK